MAINQNYCMKYSIWHNCYIFLLKHLDENWHKIDSRSIIKNFKMINIDKLL